MTTETIKKINTSIDTMQNFVSLSAQLLPYFKTLKEKSHLSASEKKDLNRIHTVFKDCMLDEKEALLIMHSDIIGIIKSTYKAINSQKTKNDLTVNYYLGRFQKEYERLSENWKTVTLN